jgi:predicted transcriptional regulator of viral defense system
MGGVSMLPHEIIQKAFQLHNGIMRTKDLINAHIFYKDIQQLMQNGIIEKVRYGYYQWAGSETLSETTTVTRLFPDAILCMDTALFYYRYSDRTPLVWHLAVSKDSNKSRFKLEYPFTKAYFLEPSILTLGAVDGTIDGVPVRIYNKERTICDCLRYKGKMDTETFNKAIQSFIEDPQKSIPRLMEYGKKLRVVQKVKTMIGVWL